MWIFNKSYLHVPALSANFKKSHTWVLLPQVVEAVSKQLAGRTKGWLFPSYCEGHISSRQVQIFSTALPLELVYRRSNTRTRLARTGIVSIRTCSGTTLRFGALIVACLWAISRTSLDILLWLPRAYTSKPALTAGKRRICGRSCQGSLQVSSSI